MSARHSSPPPTSAAVLEFICLFTHDLKRKQKRWQDGRLKYHTFNGRVMVHDDRGNFIGDMHWHHDWDLDEGEELQLERGGVIVQVQELSSRSEQDLSELIDKRVKEKEKRQMQAVARTPAPSALPRPPIRPVLTRPVPPNTAQQQHRPLHQIIGTPSGHHGRALAPKDSPFEQRQQAAESPEDRAAKRRKHNDPPPSKSGYATALFGQALTLSATPASSLPVVRRRTIRQRDPTPDIEDTVVQPVQEDPKPRLKEHPKASRHFNQSADRSKNLETAKDATPKPCEVEADNQPPARRKEDRSLPRKKSAARRRDTASVNDENDDDEVIEIDDPDAGSMVETRPPARPEKKPTNPQKARKKANVKLTGDLAKQVSKVGASRPERTENTPNEELDEDMSREQGRLAKLKKLKTKTSKPVGKKTTAKASATKNVEDPPLHTFTRNPSEPVTELRLKPRKKRGLMMMSDMAKKPRAQSRDFSNTLSNATRDSEAKEVEETDYSLRSPSPQLRTGRGPRNETPTTETTALEQEEDAIDFPSPEPHATRARDMGRNGEGPAHRNDSFDDTAMVVRRRVSVELGEEDDDPFRVPSSQPHEEDADPINQATGEQGKEMDFLDSFPEDDLGTASMMDAEVTAKKPVDAQTSITSGTTTKSPPQGKVYDPYRMLSSSPEESFEPSACLATNSESRTATVAHGGDTDAAQVAATGKALKKARRPRRNVLVDEDDEEHTLPKATEEAGVRVINVVDPESDSDLPLPRRSKQTTKRKPEAQEVDEEEIGSDRDKGIPLKEPTKPKKARKTAKRKTTAQEEEPDVQLEDDQPAKRRRGTRKSRGRNTEPGETSVASDHEHLEEDPSSKKSRREKASKASANRPRLEKIKKSVKSRELIGFNLSALDAPLGLRGIGMPFSILSSPVHESLQRRIDSHATVEPSSDSVLDVLNEVMPVATSDALQTIVEAEELALSEPRNPAAECRSEPSERATPSVEPRIVVPHSNNRESQQSAEAYSPSLSGPKPLTRHSISVEKTASKRREEETQKLDQRALPATETALPTVESAPSRPELQPANEAQIIKMVEILRQQGGQGTSKASTNQVTKTSSDLQRKVPAAPDVQSEVVGSALEPSVDTAPISLIRGPVAKAFVPPSKSKISAVQQEPSTTIINDLEDPANDAALEVVDESTLKRTSALPAFKKPEHIAPATLQRHDPSTAVKVPSDHAVSNDVELVKSTTVAPDVTVPALPPFKRPEQVPPILQHELSHTATTNPDIEAVEEAGLERNDAPTPLAISTLPAFKRPEQKIVPALRSQMSSNGRSNSAKEPIIDGEDTEPVDKSDAGVLPQSVGELAQRSTRVPRRQPPSFKPPSKTKASTVRNENGVPLPNADCDVAEVETAEAPEGALAAPEPAAPLQKPKHRTLQRTVSVTRRINNITSEPPEIARTERPASGTIATTGARITNPASRGRKAAVKSDAKGPVPQRLLPPTQPFALGPISTADFAMTPYEEPPKEPERPKKKMTFPGFQSAKDEGPWSREAYDLLESGRPG